MKGAMNERIFARMGQSPAKPSEGAKDRFAPARTTSSLVLAFLDPESNLCCEFDLPHISSVNVIQKYCK
jgi:hypothetical protein